MAVTCPCCGLDSNAHRAGCPFYEAEPTITAEEVAEGIPEDISRAYDRLLADGLTAERAAEMAVAMKRAHTSGSVARTLDQQVEHYLHLRQSLRGSHSG